MPGFHKRGEYKYEGTVESVLLLDDMSVEVIADGKHLPGTILRLVYKLKGVEMMSLVTCALKYAEFDGDVEADSDFIIEDGVCKFKDRSALAGSLATMDTVVKVAVEAGIPFVDAVRMASESPAKVMGCFDRCGSLEDGKDADIVIMNKDYKVTGVWQQGVEFTE
jgi:N-acetylglucosamine-6-phosphate deacetylase